MMELSLWSTFVVNIVINSFFSFFTLSLLVLVALNMFRIRNHRIQAICLLIPFIKLILDLGCYQFSNWALAHNLNPLDCPEGSRMFSLSCLLPPFFNFPLCSIDFHLQRGETFTLADVCCLKMGSGWTNLLACAFVGMSLFFLGKAIRQFYTSRQWLNRILKCSTLYCPLIQDPVLKMKIRRKKVSIYLSEIAHTPCIVGQWHPYIFLPRCLYENLTPQEFEAVIAHEMAHLYHGDLIVNGCLFWIRYLFWWIPTHLMQKKLELAQEYACDRLFYPSIGRVHLAEALYKAAQFHHSCQLPSFAKPFTKPHQVVKRLNRLLESPKSEKSKIIKSIKFLLVVCWMLILVCGKFWMF